MLQHDNPNATHTLLVRQVLVVDPSRHWRRAVVVQIEMELPIARPELKLLQEQRVVVQCKSVEHVEFSLNGSAYQYRCLGFSIYLLGQDEGIVDQHQQLLFERLRVLCECRFGRIVVQIRCAHGLVLGVIDDR